MASAAIACLQDCVEPAAPASAYDVSLAEAANAALQAQAAALAAQRSRSGGAEYVVREAPPPEQPTIPGGVADPKAGAGAWGVGFPEGLGACLRFGFLWSAEPGCDWLVAASVQA
jgi:hypothetical protein